MSDKTREALRKITVELAALVIDPDAERPDWMPCLMNGNSADAECLQNAYDAANDALAALSGEPEREAVGYVVIASQPVYRNKWLATTTVFDDKVVAENTAEHFNSDTPSYAIPIQYHVEPVGHAPAESERAKAHRTRWSTLAVEVGLLVLSKDESVRRMGEIMVSTMAGIEDTIPVAPAEPESKNEYGPWLLEGITELEYFKRRYLELGEQNEGSMRHVHRSLALVERALEDKASCDRVNRETGGRAPELVQGILDRITALYHGAEPESGEALGKWSDNVLLARLGSAFRSVARDPKVGDSIDRGLVMLAELEKQGFEVRALTSTETPEETDDE